MSRPDSPAGPGADPPGHDGGAGSEGPGWIDDLVDDPGAPEALAALAELTAGTPPPPLRAVVLAAIADRPRPAVVGLAPGAVYRRRVADLGALFDQLEPANWEAVAAPYAWTVHGLLAHLVVIEEYTARQLGLGGDPPLPAADPAAADHLGMGAAAIDRMLGEPPRVALGRWRAAAGLIVDHVRSDRFDPDAPTPLHGWPFDADAALVGRSFELWTHTDDINRATGRPLITPDPVELKTMSGMLVGALPLLAPAADPEPTPTRVVLTGAGGGTYDLDGPEPHRNLLVLDVVDYCRVASRRADPVAVTRVREGDDHRIDALLLASQAFAI